MAEPLIDVAEEVAQFTNDKTSSKHNLIIWFWYIARLAQSMSRLAISIKDTTG